MLSWSNPLASGGQMPLRAALRQAQCDILLLMYHPRQCLNKLWRIIQTFHQLNMLTA